MLDDKGGWIISKIHLGELDVSQGIYFLIGSYAFITQKMKNPLEIHWWGRRNLRDC